MQSITGTPAYQWKSALGTSKPSEIFANSWICFIKKPCLVSFTCVDSLFTVRDIDTSKRQLLCLKRQSSSLLAWAVVCAFFVGWLFCICNAIVVNRCLYSFCMGAYYPNFTASIPTNSQLWTVSHLHGGVDVGPCLEENLHYTGVTFVGCYHQRSTPIL